MSLDQLDQLIETTQKDIFGSILPHSEAQQIDRYMNSIHAYPEAVPYKYISSKTEEICNRIEGLYSRPALEAFHKFLLLKLIKKNVNVEKTDLPKDIISLYKINFNRITREIETNQYKGSYLYSNDKYCKDIAICSMRMIPIGARKIHISALPKRFLFKKGISQLVEGSSFVVYKLKGFKPLYEMHTDSKDPDLLSEFNPVGFTKSYLLVAELLKRHTDIKGLFATSWFYDPQLETISPRLSYIRRMIFENGGKCFFVGSDDQAIKNSTQKSMTRRKLYQEGKYLPTNYLIIWPRNKIIEWAKNYNR
jgi:hypothetical protein